MTAPVNDKIVKACQNANKAFLTGYGKVSKFIRDLYESSKGTNGPDIGEIEVSINAAVAGLDKEAIQRLDKAYQAASRRIMDHAIGLQWDDDEECGVFHIPTSRKRAKPDPINVALKDFLRNPSDQNAFFKITDLLRKKHLKALPKDQRDLTVELAELVTTGTASDIAA